MTTQSDPSAVLKDTMQTAADTGADMAREKATIAKDQTADKVDQWAEAAAAAHAEAPDASPAGDVLSQTAASLSDIAHALRSKEVDEFFADARHFAKEHPMIALGGAALAGFVAARFLKSSPGTHAQRAADDPWNNHLDRSAS